MICSRLRAMESLLTGLWQLRDSFYKTNSFALMLLLQWRWSFLLSMQLQRPKHNKRRITLSTKLSQDVIRAASEIGKAHYRELADRTIADLVVRRFRAKLIPRLRPGRPRSAAVAAALEMRDQGKIWREIYPTVFSGFWAMDKYERHVRCTNLRRAVRKAQKRGQQRQTPQGIGPLAKPE